MRYADRIIGNGAAPSTGSARTAGHAVERLTDAVRDGRFWVLHREPDDVSWTLRVLDTTTGVLGAPEHASGSIGADPGAAMDWAEDLVAVEGWVAFTDDRTTFIDEIHRVIADIAWRPRTGRILTLRVENDQHTPSLRLVVARELWPDSGRVGAPLHAREADAFRTTDAMLHWASERFGVDRAGWLTVVEGREYRHP